MNQMGKRVALGVACIAALGVADASAVRAQEITSDSLTCVNVNADRRFSKQIGPLTLTPEDATFLTNRGCKVVGGTRIARADRLCYPSMLEGRGSEPGDEPAVEGVDLSGQVFLCYDIRCERDEFETRGRTDLMISDRFGEGEIYVNERPTTKEMCVPAFVEPVSSPTPGPSATPIGTPTPTSTPGATGTPEPTASPEPTATPGSASRAFVGPVASLLR